jgi:RNA polymerase-binding transcription factor DksA
MVTTMVLQQQRAFRRRLRNAQLRLQTELRFAAAASTEWGQTARNEPEREENGVLSYERDTSLAVIGRLRGHLANIEAALARLDLGTFGICNGCGHPIAAGRLNAIPETSYCLRCARDLGSLPRPARR